MNQRVGINNIYSKKAPLHPQNGKKKELQGSKKSQPAERTMANRRLLARERKLALIQDVDNLKKKLTHEENIHRALERAFNRPLGALPRLPPYLPQYTLELLAEVAVLEEEVVRLEEQIVNFRQGLYREAVHTSSRRNPDDSSTPSRSSKRGHSRCSSQSEINLGSSHSLSRIVSSRKLLSSESLNDGLRDSSKRLSNGDKLPHTEPCFALENGLGRENESILNSYMDDNDKPFLKKPKDLTAKTATNPPKKTQCRTVEQAQESSSVSCNSDDRVKNVQSEANKLSEDILKCLVSTFVRLSSPKGKTMDSDSFSSLRAKVENINAEYLNFRDPYCNSYDFKKRDIGIYRDVYVIEARSFDLSRKTSASFLIRRLRILRDKLACVKLDGLRHHQKLAFWINIYNSCIMNAFLEHGIPESPDMIVVQMQKATIKVGGHVLNAFMIEHLILRLPYHIKYNCPKSARNDEKTICRTLGLEWSEPLVTFALSCGSWSSPAVRVYTASQIESELENAKRDYLRASVGISSSSNKLVIPKLLDWYLLDFAKDFDALLDWICMQLHDELRKEATHCLEMKGAKEPLSRFVEVEPYDFSFRYLLCR